MAEQSKMSKHGSGVTAIFLAAISLGTVYFESKSNKESTAEVDSKVEAGYEVTRQQVNLLIDQNKDMRDRLGRLEGRFINGPPAPPAVVAVAAPPPQPVALARAATPSARPDPPKVEEAEEDVEGAAVPDEPDLFKLPEKPNPKRFLEQRKLPSRLEELMERKGD